MENPKEMVSKEKPLVTEEQKMRRRAARALGRAQWLRSFKAENPKATKADIKEAWIAVSRDQARTGMFLLKFLEKQGYTVSHMPPKANKAKEAATKGAKVA